MKLNDLTIKQYLEKTASSEAMPAGGCTIALCAALASALTEMITKISLGKEKNTFANVRLVEILNKAESLRNELMNDIERDADAFQIVINSYQLPKKTEDEIVVRNNKIQKSIEEATIVQMEIAERCRQLFNYSREISAFAEGGLAADSRVSIMICVTAAKCAIINVRTNLNMVDNAYFKKTMIAKCDKIERDIDIKL